MPAHTKAEQPDTTKWDGAYPALPLQHILQPPIFDYLPVALLQLDANMCCRYVNPALVMLLQDRPAHVLGQPIQHLPLSTRQATSLAEYIRQAMINCQPSTIEVEAAGQPCRAQIMPSSEQITTIMLTPRTAEPELARQVRYQEGLAQCSRALLDTPTEQVERQQVLSHAIEHLRTVTGLSRIYMWQIVIDPSIGRAIELFAESHAAQMLPMQHVLAQAQLSIIPAALFPPEQFGPLQHGEAFGGLAEELLQNTPVLLAIVRALEIYTTYLFPIMIDGSFWGLMTCDDQRPRLWDEVERMTLSTASELFGQVIRRWRTEDILRESEATNRELAREHERLYEAARRRADELETLRQTGAVVAATLDPNEAIGRILDQIAHVVPHNSASVQLRTGDRTEIIGCRGFAHPELIRGLQFAIMGNDLHETVYEQGQPRLVPDTIGRPAFFEIIHYPILSWLGLPLTVRDRVIGMLTLDSATPGYFTEDHVRLGKAFADQVAIALDHSQLYKREVRARERLTTLQHAIRDISAQSTALPRLYSAIHHAVLQLMEADVFVILLFDPVREEIERAYLADRGELQPPERSPLPGSFADYMLGRRESLWVDDFKQFSDYTFQSFGGQEESCSGLAVLIHGRSRTLGVLFTQSYRVGAYAQDDLAMLELLATHVATALETAALFGEVGRLATTDPLMELPNRREFFRRARQEAVRAQRTQQPLSLVMLDVDRFKSVNDTYGHRTGDEVLQAIATLCRTSLRASDVAGRYGGEEIAILLPETNLADAMRTAERIRQAITQLEFDTKGGPVPVTASLGVATLQTASEEQLEDLLNWADQALYAAKQRGRNQVAIWVPQKPAPE